jgi:hypothetical protein
MSACLTVLGHVSFYFISRPRLSEATAERSSLADLCTHGSDDLIFRSAAKAPAMFVTKPSAYPVVG